MISLTFHCSGCDSTAEGTDTISRKLERVSENFCRKLPWNVEEVAPEGWIADDPYTGATYCPECWADIMAGVER